VTTNKATGNPGVRLDDAVEACTSLHMWVPEPGQTPDGDDLAASDTGQAAAKARLTLDERLAALGDFGKLWGHA